MLSSMRLRTSHMMRTIHRIGVAVVVTSAILMPQCLHFNTFALPVQDTNISNQSSAERIRELLATLEPDNTLRVALERGDKGSGMHYSWMDRMRRQGIRQ